MVLEPIHSNIFLVLCTDGISTEVSYIDIPPTERAQEAANKIFNDYHKVYGDVTVLVAKIKSLE